MIGALSHIENLIDDLSVNAVASDSDDAVHQASPRELLAIARMLYLLRGELVSSLLALRYT